MQYNRAETEQIEKMEIPIAGAEPILAYRIRGYGNGPKIVITAGVHGCEYVGIQTARALLERLKPEVLTGEVVLVPLVNAEGFYEGAKQTVPGDGKNLNRCFPGNAQGTVTERMAAALEQFLYPGTTFLIDLHGGDVNERLTPLVFYPVDGEEAVISAAKEAAKVLSVPYRVASRARNGLYSWAVQCRIPAVLLERGCQGRWSQEEVEETIQDIYRILEHFQMIEPEDREAIPAEGQQLEVGQAEYMEAESDGFWYPAVAERMEVRKGDILGYMTDISGSQLREYKSRYDGFIMYYTLSLGVKRGTPLAAVGGLPENGWLHKIY